ncbi:MAG: T9SS type A sorting domain-containing protein [candidate division Zixibacteria bacterium]|nr:T9SS type A sorting domain-containing protein [candidate division Zixibacteria bacterium]
MYKRYFVLVIVSLVFLAGNSIVKAGTYLIWDPCESYSADVLHETLQSENYDGIVIENIQPFLENLNEFKPIFVIAHWWSEYIDRDILDEVEPHLISYLANDGSIYWEGENTANTAIFNFDIATCTTEPFNNISGVSQSFETLSLATQTTTASMIGGGDGTAFCAPFGCPDKSVYQETPYKTIISSFPIDCLTDDGQNTLADFVHVLMGWLDVANEVPSRDDVSVPENYVLSQNYPNPFNAQTVLRYGLPESGRVTIGVYNILGQPVDILFRGWQQAGQYSLTWNADDNPTGVYFARMESGSYAECVKMVLMK